MDDSKPGAAPSSTAPIQPEATSPDHTGAVPAAQPGPEGTTTPQPLADAELDAVTGAGIGYYFNIRNRP